MHLFKGARYKKYRKDAAILDPHNRAKNPQGLLQVVNGRFRVEAEVPGRLQALIVGRLGPGELIGVSSLLLRDLPFAKVVCDSDEAAVVRLPREWMEEVFLERPVTAGKFYFFLAQRQAERLRKITEQLHKAKELRLNEDVASRLNMPETMGELVANDAFFILFDKFVKGQSRDKVDRYERLMIFVHAVHALQKEADTEAVRWSVASIIKRHVEEGSEFDVFQTLPAEPMTPNRTAVINSVDDELRKTLESVRHSQIQFAVARRNSAAAREGRAGGAVGDGGGEESSLGEKESAKLGALYLGLRHIFDGLLGIALATLESGCMPDFLASPYCDYMFNLRLKETQPLTLDHFVVARLLGRGGFGQVVEAVKRDCGKHYAMKVMEKKKLVDVYGEDEWERLAMSERTLLSSLRHPLLINLAFAFQNISFLVMVTDVCYGGDLAAFGVEGDAPTLSEEQVRFVGLETVAVIHYLHSQRVLFRDLKPANLLLDGGGHVRLIDFGIAKQSKDKMAPVSTEECGTPAYMAPEVKRVTETGKKYSYSCDWFSLGVMLYELQERAYPYGPDPLYEDVMEEFVQPKLLSVKGVEIEHMYDLVSGLLDWDTNERLGICGGIDALQSHPYWGDADWELISHGKTPSPLKDVADERISNFSALAEQSELFAGSSSNAEAASVTAELNRAQEVQHGADLAHEEEGKRRRSQDFDSSPDRLSAKQEEVLKEEFAMNVEEWDFVSEYAIAQEYVEQAANMVSAV